ncbi:MAG: class I SAM-dependent methyltransferase [Bacteroidales bacterium]|nr:class I SAM-dependent methyltransferase [Bacteroidales bacterium]
MKLTPSLEAMYTHDTTKAGVAQRRAQEIAFAPVVFQVSRLMIKYGILEMLQNRKDGATEAEIAAQCGISRYAAKVLLEASLSIGTVIVDGDNYKLTKTGWFLLNDESTRADLDFNHDVNYLGLFYLDEALEQGKPAGLKVFGEWPTIYEALSSLPDQVKKSWFGFDHFYSDNSFKEALEMIFDKAEKPVRKLLDVGGNTGRWAMQCVGHNKDVNVTIMDLPQQIGMMREQTAGKDGADRIHGFPGNLLDENTKFPTEHFDVIWMSQFLDCFSEEQIVSILRRAAESMDADTRIYIMETFWDRQKYETAAYVLTLTSIYFTALANGNSKMYHSDDMARLVEEAGLEVEALHDNLGLGHSIMVCRKK